MPPRSKKSSRRHVFRSTHKRVKMPTLKHHKWRVKSHTSPSRSKQVTHRSFHRSIPHSQKYRKGKRVMLSNIHRPIAHLIPYNMNVGEAEMKEEMAVVPQSRQRHSRAAKNAYQARRNAEAASAAAQAAAEEDARAARASRAAQRSAHLASVNELTAKMGNLGF